MNTIILKERRDEHLKRRYLKKLQKLGINDPRLLVLMADYLKPERVAYHREDMHAVIYGEPTPLPQAITYKKT